MCIFSGAVESVSNTLIFARPGARGTQYLVYKMQYQADSEVAMVLPIPVREGTAERGVKFINLERYERFFDDMRRGWPLPRAGATKSLSRSRDDAKLVVQQVGSYEASFVPSVADFSRLDERFRLPEGTWDKLPGYAKFGFAVFKLKAGNRKVHPMAFRFPSAAPDELFFPTVHIHDGEVHERARFDHTLYLQLAPESRASLRGWSESTRPAGMFLNAELAGELIDPDEHCYQRRLRGRLKNGDVRV